MIELPFFCFVFRLQDLCLLVPVFCQHLGLTIALRSFLCGVIARNLDDFAEVRGGWWSHTGYHGITCPKWINQDAWLNHTEPHRPSLILWSYGMVDSISAVERKSTWHGQMVWSRLTEGMQSEMHIPILNFGDQDQEIWVDLFGS